jgi:hypothetical protein
MTRCEWRPVVPANAGINRSQKCPWGHMFTMGPRLRGDDGCGVMLAPMRLRGDKRRGAMSAPMGLHPGMVSRLWIFIGGHRRQVHFRRPCRKGRYNMTVVITEAATALLIGVGVALDGTSSVLYGSVAELARSTRRARAFAIFYTVTLGASALAHLLCG